METAYQKYTQWSYFPSGALRSYKWQKGVKQKPFVDKPLPYQCTLARQTAYKGTGTWSEHSANPAWTGCDSTAFWPENPIGWSEMAIAVNKAREKFLSTLGGSADLGTTIVEWRSSLEMITLRANRLFEGYRHLKKGRFKSFLKTFDARPKAKDRRKTWSKPKDASAIWIEYWFGWAPTIGDIYASIDVIQNPVRGRYIEAASGRKATRSASWRTPEIGDHWSRKSRATLIAKYGGYVTITNPNLYQANQLGLVNPAVILWEVTPFSWFVDWFANVGTFLKGFSDTLGLSFSQLYLTRFSQAECDYYFQVDRITAPSIRSKTEKAERMDMVRSLEPTLRPPQLNVALPLELSHTRAATAISLLVLLFTSEKKL